MTASSVALAGTAIASGLDGDADMDLSARMSVFLDWAGHAASSLSGPSLGALLVICLLHYLAAAAAARAAAGVPLHFAELVATQLTAATANRITPAGIGGAGVLGRFYIRRGLSKTEATAALSAMAILGGVADVLAFCLLLSAGVLFGVAGAESEIPLLLTRLTTTMTTPPTWARWTIMAALSSAIATLLVLKLRGSRRPRLTGSALARYGRAVAAMSAQPKRIAVMMSASAATTVSMSAGFATAAVLGPAALPPSKAGALMIGYLFGSAAANAVPSPGGLGSTDAALAGVLVLSGTKPAAAFATVLAFRVVTFWLPAAAGVGAARWLRRRGAL